jgi:hypothetical protein
MSDYSFISEAEKYNYRVSVNRDDGTIAEGRISTYNNYEVLLAGIMHIVGVKSSDPLPEGMLIHLTNGTTITVSRSK